MATGWRGGGRGEKGRWIDFCPPGDETFFPFPLQFHHPHPPPAKTAIFTPRPPSKSAIFPPISCCLSLSRCLRPPRPPACPPLPALSLRGRLATTPKPDNSHLLAPDSMSNTDFLGRAIDTVKKAIENDNEGEYEKAYQLYYSALELFMLALKWEKNPRSKEMIRSKTGEYMDRAEKLKNHIASAESGKKASAVGANGKVAQGSGKGEYVFSRLLFADLRTYCWPCLEKVRLGPVKVLIC